MTEETAVREALAHRAAQVDPVPLLGPALRHRAVQRRRQAWRGWLAAAVATSVVALLAVAVPQVFRRTAPALSAVEDWPVRGDLAGDTALHAAARAAWEDGPVYDGERPYRDMRVLLADRTPWGRYVVLTARNALGHRRLAVLADDPRHAAPYRGRLRLRGDTAFPEGLVTYAEKRDDQVLLLALAPPDVDEYVWWTAVDDEPRPLAHDRGALAEVVTAPTAAPRVAAYRDGRPVGESTEPGGRTFVYDPDPALVRGDQPRDGQAPSGDSGGGLVGGFRRSDWKDMADQAEQLWLNQSLPGHQVRRWTWGEVGSALLPDGTGVHLAKGAADGAPPELLLYVDRPEWRLGSLAVSRELRPGQPVPALTAVLQGRPGPDEWRLVAVAGPGVRVEVADLPGDTWREVPLTRGAGVVTVADPEKVKVRYVVDGVAGPPQAPDGFTLLTR